jgi:hypothetical protein
MIARVMDKATMMMHKNIDEIRIDRVSGFVMIKIFSWVLVVVARAAITPVVAKMTRVIPFDSLSTKKCLEFFRNFVILLNVSCFVIHLRQPR